MCTQPGGRVNPVVAQAMKEVGADIRGDKPKMLTFDMVDGAERMITMGCGAEAGALRDLLSVRKETDPGILLEQAMAHPSVPMHGPEHHVGSYRDRGGSKECRFGIRPSC